MPHVEFLHEFHHRYIKDGPMIQYRKRPFYPESIEYDQDETSFIVRGKSILASGTRTSKAVRLNEDSLNLSFPQPGWINVDHKTCVYFYINPIKQWRFAITPNLCIFFNPLKAEYSEHEWMGITGSTPWKSSKTGKKLAAAMFDRKYFSIRQAYNLLVEKKTRFAVAFSKDFALVAKKYSKYPVVYYRTYPIGFCTSAKTVVISEEMSFLKEMLQEYFLKVEEV